jgi:hypothetical protein
MIRPPIIVDAKSELLLFRSVERAEAYLEAVDVRNGEYAAAYDSDGRRLELGTKIVTRRVFLGLVPSRIECASLRATDDRPSHTSELRELLEVRLSASDASTVSQCSNGGLITMAVERWGYAA